MGKQFRWFGLVFLVFLQGCFLFGRGGRSEGAEDSVHPVILPGDQLAYTISPAFGVSSDSIRMVIRDQRVVFSNLRGWEGRSLEEVWAEVMANEESPRDLKGLDHRRRMVVVVGAGARRPPDRISVDSAGVQGGTFKVFFTTYVECRDFPSLIYPLHMVSVSRSEAEILFVNREIRGPNCG